VKKAMASTTVLEVVAHAFQTVYLAHITIYVIFVQFHMAPTVPEVVAYVLQTVYIAIKINAPGVHLYMASTVLEVVAHAL
jgi:hypothetical protein